MRPFDKTVNVRLLAILLLVGAVSGGGIHWLHGFQARRQAGFFLDQADVAIEEGRAVEALRHLNRYIALRPDDVDVLEKLGLFQVDCGLIREAYITLEKTLRKSPDRPEVRRKLIDLAIKNRRFSDARQHISPRFFPGSYKDNELQDAELLVMLATCQAASREDNRGAAEAKASLERAIELEPDRLEAYQRLATLLRTKLDDPSGADRVMNDMVEENEGSTESLVARAGYWFGLARLEAVRLERSEAEQLFEAARDDALAALKSAPPDTPESASEDPSLEWIPGALWIAARSLYELGQFDEARTHAERGIKVAPRLTMLYNLLAQIELAQIELQSDSDKLQEAIAAIERVLERNPNNPDLLWKLATISIQLRDVDRAEEAVKDLEEIDNLAHPTELLRGQIACLQGQWVEGRKKLEAARPKVLDIPDLAKRVEYWLGHCHGGSGKMEDQLAAYQKAIRLDSRWIPPRLAKASVLSATGRPDAAIAEYQELRGIEGRTRIELARLLVAKNARAQASSRNWQEIEQVLDELPDADQKTLEVLKFRAECLSQTEDFKAAEELLAAAEKDRPAEELAEIRRVRAALLQRQGKWPEVEKLFAKAKLELGNSAALQLGLAGLLVREFGSDAKGQLRDLAGEAEELSGLEQVELRRGLMVLSFGVGDLEQVERLYQLASPKAPRDAVIQRLMFEVAVSKKDRDAIEGALRMIGHIPDQKAFWHYGEAVRQRLMAGEETEDKGAQQRFLAIALEHLTEADALPRSREDMARIHLLTGEIHDIEGRQAEALDRYLAAAKLRPIPVDALQRAVYLLYQQGRIPEADQLMARIDSPQIELKPELTPYLAESLYRAAEDTRAIEVAEAVATVSGEYQDHLRLAEILRLSALRAESEDQSREMLGKAEQSYRKAVELGPDSPAAWVSLIRFLHTDQPEAAQTALVEFQEDLPPDGAPYELAICYDMLGQPEESKSELAKIIEGGPKFPPAQVNWARRKLASIMLRRPDYAILEQAEELLRRNLAPEPEAGSVLDKRALATVLSVYADPDKRREAIRLLEELVEGAAEPQDRFSLAKLYLARDDWAEASRLFSLVAAESDRPEYIAAYVDALLDHDQVSDADSWMKRLIELAPGESPTDILQARVRFKQGRAKDAIGLIKPLAGDANATPDQVLKLAAFLGQHGQADEAMALIEGVQEDADPASLIGVCTNAVHGGKATPSQAERIEAVVEAALDKQTPSAKTLLILADLRIAQERFDDVEDAYRRVIELDADNVIALNNLAVLSALKKENLDEAVRMIDRAINLAPPNGILLDSQATVYLANGRASEALDSMQKAIAEDPKPSRYFHLAQVQNGLRNPQEAKKALLKARELGLTPQMLHPLERPEYNRLLKMLDD